MGKHTCINYLSLKTVRLEMSDRENEKKSVGRINHEQSNKICQLLTSLNHLEHISISPLRLKKKDLQYLSFWFHGEFGGITTGNERWNRATNTALMDITLTNNRP